MFLTWPFRPIGREEQAAAAKRLHCDPLPPPRLNDDGTTTVFWYRGTVDVRDYTLRDGYVVVVVGQDRYGWPKGHPDSPASAREIAT